jgi:two-component sensor histidine kinase
MACGLNLAGVFEMLYSFCVGDDGRMRLEWRVATSGREVMPAEVASGSCWAGLVDPEEHGQIQSRTQRLLSGSPSIDEVRLRSIKGRRLRLRLYGRPEKDRGNVVRIIGAAEELGVDPPSPSTADLFWSQEAVARLQRQHAEQQAQLARALAEKDAALTEVRHRLANNLQMAISAMRLQSRSQDSARSAEEAIGRLSAIAFAQRQIQQAPATSPAPADAYLRTLCEHLHAIYENPRIGLSVAADPFEMDRDGLTVLGMIVHELVANACKHAFNGQSQGRLEVRLQRGERGQAVLTVSDDGIGMPPETRRGQGLMLLDAFVRQLQGELHIVRLRRHAPHGTEVRITFPIPG